MIFIQSIFFKVQWFWLLDVVWVSLSCNNSIVYRYQHGNPCKMSTAQSPSFHLLHHPVFSRTHCSSLSIQANERIDQSFLCCFRRGFDLFAHLRFFCRILRLESKIHLSAQRFSYFFHINRFVFLATRRHFDRMQFLFHLFLNLLQYFQSVLKTRPLRMRTKLKIGNLHIKTVYGWISRKKIKRRKEMRLQFSGISISNRKSLVWISTCINRPFSMISPVWKFCCVCNCIFTFDSILKPMRTSSYLNIHPYFHLKRSKSSYQL